jgi:hypothetical protein
VPPDRVLHQGNGFLEIGDIETELNRLHGDVEIAGPFLQCAHRFLQGSFTVASLALLNDPLERFFLCQKHCLVPPFTQLDHYFPKMDRLLRALCEMCTIPDIFYGCFNR